MTGDKIEKLTFITLYDEQVPVRTITRQKPGALPLGEETEEASSVNAKFRASYCDAMGVLLCETGASNGAFWSLDWLPGRTLENVGGLTVSQAVREIVKRADAWSETVAALVDEHAPGGKLTPADAQAVTDASAPPQELIPFDAAAAPAAAAPAGDPEPAPKKARRGRGKAADTLTPVVTYTKGVALHGYVDAAAGSQPAQKPAPAAKVKAARKVLAGIDDQLKSALRGKRKK
jgi:hypothetical protein